MMHWAFVVSLLGCRDEDGDDSGRTDSPTTEPCYTLADGRCVEETFDNPPVLNPDADGVYRLSLAASEVVIDGDRHCARVYNGALPGPTIVTEARQGDVARSIRVDMLNKLTGHDYRDLAGQDCTCVDDAGATCLPQHVHDPCDAGAEETCACTNEDGEECHMADFNVTNLHAHGAHVRPDYARGGAACEPEVIEGVVTACRECGDDVCDGDDADDACFHGDNVLNAIHPWEGARYRWGIDEDGTHHTGLQWYHPHIHGTTAIQVASGATGAWIVRGPLDALPGIQDAEERVMLFSTPPVGDGGFEPLAEGEACSETNLTMNDFAVLGDFLASQTNLINGARRPRMVTPPDQVERWRIVHAGFLDEVFLGLFQGEDGDCSAYTEESLPLTQIGRDGLILPQTYTDDYVFMSPGYRVEAMLGGDGVLKDGDTWCLVSARFLQDGEGAVDEVGGQPSAPAEPPSVEEILARFRTDGDVVAILNVTASAGTATETKLPDPAAIAALAPPVAFDGVDVDAACAEAATVTEPEDLDQAAVLQVGFWTVDDDDPCDCAGYNVNCNNFEETDRSVYPVDRDLMLDEVDHWRIQASQDGHPFHIHINPFVVCPNDNVFDPLPFAHWRDTYLVNVGRKIDLLTQNRKFTGPYVLHCHKLTHEDHGMMEVIRVCDPATDPTCGAFAWRACEPDDLDCQQALAATDCALASNNELETGLCMAELAFGVCAPDACATDADCADAESCQDGRCAPAVCTPPCAPGQSCVHGDCE
jgi:FtsP/CotA-like multicopper oxidase with cupredoxin domain